MKDTDQERMSEIKAGLSAKLDQLSVYELRALYYLLRANAYSVADEPRLRFVTVIEAMVGELSTDECLHLTSVVMAQLGERDVDLVAAQMIIREKINQT